MTKKIEITVRKATLLCLLLAAMLLVSCAGPGTASIGPASDASHPSTDAATQPQSTEDPDTTSQPTETESGVEISESSTLRFLTDSNTAQALYQQTELVPPGTLTEVDCIPQPEQTLVGTTVEVAFEPTRVDDQVFHFMRNAQTGEERLVVFVCASDTRWPLMIVFKTDFGGAERLLEHVLSGTSFCGEIVAMVNVDPVEGRVYVANTARENYQVAPEEIVNVSQPGQLGGAQYIGILNSGEVQMKGISGDSISTGLHHDLKVFWDRYDRFGLRDMMPVDEV